MTPYIDSIIVDGTNYPNEVVKKETAKEEVKREVIEEEVYVNLHLPARIEVEGDSIVFVLPDIFGKEISIED